MSGGGGQIPLEAFAKYARGVGQIPLEELATSS